MAVQLSEEGKMDPQLALVRHDLILAMDKDMPIESRLYRTTQAAHSLLLYLEKQATTVVPTTTASTPGDPSVVEEAHYTTRSIRESVQSAMKTEDAGPVGLNCECVKPKLDVNWHRSRVPKGPLVVDKIACENCGASLSFDRTPAPAAVRDSSTSVKQDLKSSAETSPSVDAEFPSKPCPETDMGINHPEHSWTANTMQGNYRYSCPGLTREKE